MLIKRTILIVDDDELMSETTQNRMLADDHMVSCCFNRTESIKLSKEQNYDVISTDHHTFGMTVHEV